MNTVVARHRSTILLFAVAILAWAVTAQQMRGMDDGPGTDLGGLEWYLGVWAAMTAAMMLPSATPAARQVARLARRLPTLLFVIGYLAVWIGFGLTAYGLFRLVSAFDTDWLAWDRAGAYVTGGVIIAAGMYELTPPKQASLRRCRGGQRAGGPLRRGLVHGLDCVGCSGGLMVALFALGVMSLLWMGIVATVIFAEKVLPQGAGLSRVFAFALVALGIWVIVSPASVPGLTQPDESPAMRMES